MSVLFASFMWPWFPFRWPIRLARDLVGRDMMGLNGFKGAKQEGCFSAVGVGMKNCCGYVVSVGGMRKRQVGGWVRERGDWSVGERTDWWCLCGLCLLLTFVSLGAFLLFLIYLKHTGRRIAFILNCEWYWKQTKEEHTYSNILSMCSKEWPFFIINWTIHDFIWFRLAWPRSHCWSVWCETPLQDSFFPDWLFCPPFAWREVESEQTAPFSLLVNQWASTLQSSEVFRVSGLSHQSRVSGPSQITPGTHFPPSS